MTSVRRTTLPLLLAIACAAWLSATAPGARSAATRADVPSVTVRFEQRLCASAKPRTRGVPNARLRISWQGHRQVLDLDGDGSTVVPRALVGERVHAELILLDPGRLQLGSPVRNEPYRIDLGMVVLRGGAMLDVDAERNARGPIVANTWWILDLARTRAALAAPTDVKLKTLRGAMQWDEGLRLVVDDDIPNSGYDHKTDILYVAVKHAHERLPIVHEVGHWLHDHAAPGRPQQLKDGHDMNRAYPGTPTAIFAEGLANGFASVALGDPRPSMRCDKQTWDLEADPPTPTLTKPQYHLTQHHEISIAAAVWNASITLGGGRAIDKRLAGFRMNLDALRSYKRVLRRNADTTREWHDALLEAGHHGSTRAEYIELISAFTKADIGWGVAAGIEIIDPLTGEHVDGNSTGDRATERVTFTLTGPDGFSCTGRSGDAVVRGPVAKVNADDCFAAEDSWTKGGDLDFRQMWRPNGRHIGNYVLRAHYSCVPGEWDPESDEPQHWYRCPGSRGAELSFANGPGVDQDEGDAGYGGGYGCWEISETAEGCTWSASGLFAFGEPPVKVTLSRSSSGTVIARFGYRGFPCTATIVGRDCKI